MSLPVRPFFALPLLLCLLLAACAPAPTPAATASSFPPAGSGQEVRNDPAQPVFLAWPELPDAPGLGEAIRADLKAREEGFLADYAPNDVAPPELHAGWATVVDAPGAVIGVRSEVYEFAGASGAASSETLYADRATGALWRGRDLVAAEDLSTLVAAVVRALAATGYAVDASDVPDAVRTRLLDDLTFTTAGDLVVRVSDGVLLVFSEGTVDAVVPARDADPFLTDAGRLVRAAFAQAGPTAPPSPVTPSSTTPSPAASAEPAAPAASGSAGAGEGGSVDCAQEKCVALTFDDGPGRDTSRLLDALAELHAPATFFLLGQNVERQPAVVARMAAEGHEIGNHTWDHKQLTKLPAAAQRREIERAAAAIEAAGARATLFRPPYGSRTATTDAAAGLPVVLWDVDTLDWKTRDTEATVAAALSGAKRGSIVLLHDIHAPTVAAVPRIVAGLRERGFSLVTVSQLLGEPRAGEVYSHRS